jgi:hypothetical protein
MVNLGGLIFWREIISAAMNLQSQSSLGQAGLLVGRERLHRIDATSPGKPIALDDYDRASKELPSLAAEIESKLGPNISKKFFTEDAIPFEAFHGPRAGA